MSHACTYHTVIVRTVLSNLVTNVSTALPLTTRLSWNLESTPQLPDCVVNYSLSFNGNRFITSNTYILPIELLNNYGFPVCMNQPLKISPIIPAIGDIDSSSSTVMIRVEEGLCNLHIMLIYYNYN